jgi:protein-tyrosine phosphatase
VSADGGGAPARLLVVCTGNVCRSPAAELLLRAGLGAGADVVVGSAGLGALVGQPIEAPMARLLERRGVDPSAFAARQLTDADTRQADVVLTMTSGQRAAVVAHVPSAVRRTFLLRELADLAQLTVLPAEAGTPAERLAAVVSGAPQSRARRAVVGDDDVEDPYRRPDEVFARSLQTIADAVDRLVAVLAPAARPVTVGEVRPDRLAGHPPSSGEPARELLTQRSDL